MNCEVCNSPLPDDAAFCPYCGSRIEGVEEHAEYEYEAFISYRHLPTDRTVAVKLQRALEGFAIPKHLRNVEGKRRLGKCFRDEDELPTSSSLSEQIERALKRSRYLIVICTPQTRESQWVMQEVELFSAYHGRDRVLLALADAEPEDSFPKLLLSKLQKNEDGNIVALDVEPMAADFRDLSRQKFSLETQRVAAALIGCSFDDLRQRARARRMKLVTGIASGIAAISIAFSGVTLYQQSQINENYRQIQIRESELLANESAELLAKGDRYQAVQVALAALPESSTSNDRPFVPAAQMALENALGVYPQKSDWISTYSQTDLGDRGFSNGASFSETGLAATVAYDESITVSEIATGTVVSQINARDTLGADYSITGAYVGLIFSGEKLITIYKSSIGCFDARQGTLEWENRCDDERFERLEASDQSIALSPDGATLAVFEAGSSESGSVKLIEVASGDTARTIPLPDRNQLDGANTLSSSVYLDFDEIGGKVAVSIWGYVFLIDTETGATEQRKLAFDYAKSVNFLDSRLTVASQDGPIGGPETEASLEVFDRELTPLWDKRAILDVGLDATGIEYWYKLGAFATWSYYEKDDRQFVVLLGKNLYLLDSETGEEVFSIGCDSAFLNCGVLGSDSGGRLYFCTSSGDIGVRIPYERNSGHGGAISDVNLEVGSLEHGRFVEMNGETYLFAWTEVPIKCMVYRNEPSGNLGIENEFEGDLSDMRRFVWSKYNDEVLYAFGASRALRFNAHSLEVEKSIDLSSIEGRDPDVNAADVFGAVSRTGDLYYATPIIVEEEGRSHEETGIYRLSADSTIEPLCRINESYITDMRIVRDASGIEKLHVVAFDTVMTIDLDDPLSEEASSALAVPNVEEAWYLGDQTIVCGNGVLVDDESYYAHKHPHCRLALIQSATGEEIPSDLGSYSLPTHNKNKLASVSDDGKYFVAACSDGITRLFDAKQGSLIWETTDVPGSVRILQITHEGNVFIQDAFYNCYLLSGSTGKTIKASSTPIPRLDSIFRDNGSTITASFKDAGLLGGGGIVVISLDEEMFGPQSIMYNCMITAADNRTFLFKNPYTDNYYIAERLSLDELISQARELVSEHQLTSSEQHLYNVSP